MQLSFSLLIIMTSLVIASALPAYVPDITTISFLVPRRVPKSYDMVDDKAGLSPLIEWANSKEASVDASRRTLRQ